MTIDKYIHSFEGSHIEVESSGHLPHCFKVSVVLGRWGGEGKGQTWSKEGGGGKLLLW